MGVARELASFEGDQLCEVPADLWWVATQTKGIATIQRGAPRRTGLTAG
jgi:hypothetical protein